MPFRPATNQDTEEVRRLVFGVLAEYGLQADPANTDRDLDDLEASYTRAGGVFELLLDDTGRIIGSYGLCPRGSETCELRKMYLEREARGRWLGKAILRRALDRARALGFRHMCLETSRVLREAISLYRSFGFEEYQPAHMSARCDIAMRLNLDSRGS